jgi:hypothetical protein
MLHLEMRLLILTLPSPMTVLASLLCLNTHLSNPALSIALMMLYHTPAYNLSGEIGWHFCSPGVGLSDGPATFLQVLPYRQKPWSPAPDMFARAKHIRKTRRLWLVLPQDQTRAKPEPTRPKLTEM